VTRRATAGLALMALAVTGCAAEGSAAASRAEPDAGRTGLVGSVWVADEGGDSLTVLDADSGTVLMTLTGIPAPHNVQAAASGRPVWAVSGAGVLVALADDGSVLGTAGTDEHPAHVVGAADGGVLVSAGVGASVTVYDAALRPTSRAAVPGSPHGLRLTPDGRTAVVANTAAGTVDLVDLPAGAVTARIPVGPSPIQVAVSDDGRWAYASVAGSAEVVRVDLAREIVTDRAAVPAAPAQVLLTGAGELLVADQGTERAPGRTVTVLDPETLELLGRVEVGAGPHGLTSDPDGRIAWVTNVYDDTVSAIDLRARRVLRTVAVGGGPNGVTFSSAAATGTDRSLELPGTGAGEDGGSPEHDQAGDAHDHADDGHDHAGDRWWPQG
jgi:YVTN family beta-propeller protein